MFDEIERKVIENMGLNCLLIDESNKDKKLIELDYLNKEKFSFNKKVSNTTLGDKETFRDLNICFCGFPVLVINPKYWNDEYTEIVNKYRVESLIFSTYLTTFLKKQTIKAIPLQNIEFLKKISHIKHFYLEHLNNDLFAQNWEVKDFSLLETMHQLECLGIPNYETFIDIDFTKLQNLKEFNLQFPKKNKTIYECKKIERAKTRYYEKDLSRMSNWTNLNYFSAYCDNLVTLEGLENFTKLEELKCEFTSTFQSFKGAKSKSIKTFYYYTEARKTPTTLEGISGFENVEILAFSGLKKLETVADLPQCKYLKELRLEESYIPDDIERILEIKSLKKLIVDYGEDVSKKYPRLKPLIFSKDNV